MEANLLVRLFIDELRSLYSAENQLVRALPKMADAASVPELQASFEEHIAQTGQHIARLENIFETLGQKPKGRLCKGMASLIRTGNQLIHENTGPEVLDACLIATARRLQHFGIAGYGSLCQYAKLLDDAAAAALLSATLEEKKEVDANLTRLSEQFSVDLVVRF
jgi:ferritin-like metal-binding protein YciE